jgi:hypothetical protein
MMRIIKGLAVVGVLAALSSPASAGNLLTNGSFETGCSFAGWTLAHGSGSGNTATVAAANDFVWSVAAPYTAQNGVCDAIMGDPIGNGASISQTLHLATGKTLDLVYWLKTDGYLGANSFSLLWNGNTVSGSVLANDTSTTWTRYVFSVVTSGTSDTVQVQAGNANGFYVLDNMFLGSYVPVPEPGSLALIGMGLLGAAGVGFRRRSRKA